jgi:hypothetical protein
LQWTIAQDATVRCIDGIKSVELTNPRLQAKYVTEDIIPHMANREKEIEETNSEILRRLLL